MTQPSPEGSWWSREGGIREVLITGLPLVISTSTFAFMYFCDRLFLTWYDTRDMAAVMQSGALSWSISAFPLGLASYAIAFVAQYRGSGRPDRIGAVVWHASAITLAALPLFLVAAWICPWLFGAFGHEPDLIERETLYFRVIACGMPAMTLGAALNSFFVGLDRTRFVMLIDIAAAIVNVLLDYVMIFGWGPFPEGGLAGAGWATVIAMWFKVVVYLAWLIWQPDRSEYRFDLGWRFDRDLAYRIWSYGGPNGLQFLLEGSTFTIVLLFLGKLGPLALEATSLAISVNLVAFVPILGIAMAVTSMVGNQVGRKRPDLAARVTWSGVWIASVYSGIFAIAYLFFPGVFLIFHELDPVEQRDLLSWSLLLLRFVAAYCLFDALQLVFGAAIKGAGDTWFTVKTLIGTTIIVVLGGALLENLFTGFAGKVLWWWSCLTGWLVLLAVAFGWRFLQGRWRTMTVLGADAE